jgi:hypothetical protein
MSAVDGAEHGSNAMASRYNGLGAGGALPRRHLSNCPTRSSSEPVDGRVALVSGGNRSLGLQIVRKLAERGVRVVLGSRSVEGGRATLDLLGNLADRVGHPSFT